MISLGNITYYIMIKLDEADLDVRLECLTSKLDSRVRVISNIDNKVIEEYYIMIEDSYCSIFMNNELVKSYKSESSATNFIYDDVSNKLLTIKEN